MARKPSAVLALTPTEKKAAVAAAKDTALSAKKALAELNKARSTDVATRTAALKAEEKARGVASKAYDALLKEHDKKITAAQKAATNADAALNALSPPKAVASPTTPV